VNINWADLGEVFVASLVAAICVITLFSVGVNSLARQESVKESGGSGSANLAGAVICFGLCVVIVAYGIFLIVAK
jgi:hypothetical protein